MVTKHSGIPYPGFPKGGANPRMGANLLFGKGFAENCMKMKEIRPEGGCMCLVSPWTCHSNMGQSEVISATDPVAG